MYALSGSGIKISLDGGVTWTVDVMEDALNLLPTDNVNMFSFASPVNDNTNNLVLVGNRDASFTSDAYAMVWGKVEENAAGSENQPWAYYNITEENKYPAPRLTNLQTVKYGDAIMAFGGSGLGLSTEKAFNKFYMSYDKGITWQNDSLITQPIGFKCAAESFALVADNNNCIWLICGGSGQVWKGHINKVAWKEE
jgi:mannose-6-phosphate isomerase-like protein (cupin superfamily)